MRYETIDDTSHIWCDEGESEREVLRAITNATFETAATGGMGLLHYDKSTILPDELLDQMIRIDDDHVLHLDYVQGRAVKTILDRVEPGHFALDNWLFERDRGKPDTMLDRAKEILGGSNVTGQGSTGSTYQGESLDIVAKSHFQVERNPGEDDWSFRQRIFVDHYDTNSEEALCFILGGTFGDFDEMDAMLVTINAATFGTVYGRRRFATGFADDPLVMRRDRQHSSAR